MFTSHRLFIRCVAIAKLTSRLHPCIVIILNVISPYEIKAQFTEMDLAQPDV